MTAIAGEDPRADAPAEILDRPVPDGLRRVAIGVVTLRLLLPFVAVPLIPFLLADRIALLVLLRPQKEFLLLAGAQARLLGHPSLVLVAAAYVPFMVVAVWAFFVVGRAYRPALRNGGAPAWLNRIVPPRRLEAAERVLARRGPSIAVLGRLAAFPPTVLAAAAGTSDVHARRYLVADAIGAATSLFMVLAAGYGLGRAFEQGGWWLTAVGAAVLVVLIVLLTRWLREDTPPPNGTDMNGQSPSGTATASSEESA